MPREDGRSSLVRLVLSQGTSEMYFCTPPFFHAARVITRTTTLRGVLSPWETHFLKWGCGPILPTPGCQKTGWHEVYYCPFFCLVIHLLSVRRVSRCLHCQDNLSRLQLARTLALTKRWLSASLEGTQPLTRLRRPFLVRIMQEEYQWYVPLFPRTRHCLSSSGGWSQISSRRWLRVAVQCSTCRRPYRRCKGILLLSLGVSRLHRDTEACPVRLLTARNLR